MRRILHKLPDIKANAAGSTLDIPATMDLTGELTFLATSSKEDGALPSFTLLANTGVPMSLTGFVYPVVVDLAGAKFDKKVTAVIADHTPSQRIGHATEQIIIPAGGTGTLNGKAIKGPIIAAMGVQSSSMQVATDFVADARKGFPFQVSIGAGIVPGKAFFVAEGEKVEVNGKTFKGPLIVARNTIIRELSVTTLGADSKTSAKVSAQFNQPSGKGNNMDFTAYLKSLGLIEAELSETQLTGLKAAFKKSLEAASPPAPVKASGKPVVTKAAGDGDDDGDPVATALKASRATLAEDGVRINSITATAAKFANLAEVTVGETKMSMVDFQAHAVQEGMSGNEFELHCRRSEMPVPNQAPAIHTPDRNIEAQALEASLCVFFGVPETGINASTGKKFGLTEMFSDEVLNASESKQYRINGSVQALLDLQIQAAGGHFSGLDRKGSDFVAAAVAAHSQVQASGMSTLNVINILENTMHKVSLAAFEGVEGVWRQLCGRQALTDFRPHNLYRLDYNGHFRQVATDGELKHISMVDTKKSIEADTYGAMIAIDRKTIRNDDLGLIVQQARGLGTLGGQRIEESVMGLLLSNPGSFFSAANGNLITGADSELNNVEEGKGLDMARQNFRSHVINGKPIGVSPQVLLTGTTRESTAKRLYREERVHDNTNENFMSNPHQGLYTPVVSPYLNNTSITDQDGAAIAGQSDTQWFLFASPNAPQGSALVIGFMDGRETPYFDEAETQFNTPGGIQMRSYLDWGVAMHIEQMGLKSAGA